MNHLTRVVSLLAFLLVGANAAWGDENHAQDLSKIYLSANTTYNYDQEKRGYKFAWSQQNANVSYVQCFGVDHVNGTNLSEWEGLRIKVSSLKTGPFKVTIKTGDITHDFFYYTDYGELNGYKDFSFSSFDLTKVKDISIAGASDNGEVIIQDIYLYKNSVNFLLSNSGPGVSTLQGYVNGNVGTEAKGIRITDGNAELSFKATPNDGKVFWHWQVGTNATSANNHYEYGTNPYAVNVSSLKKYKDNEGNIPVIAVFHDGVTINAGSDGNGSAKFSVEGQEQSNGYKSRPYRDYVFTAIPKNGYTFVGWYNGEERVSQDNPYTKGDGGKDLTLTAKFEQENHPAITCRSNTIDLTKVAASSGAAFNEDGTHTGTTTDGSYISIKFATPQDLHELTSITTDGINITKTNNSAFHFVRFIYDNDGHDDSFDKYNNINIINNFVDGQSDKLKTVKEIRYYGGKENDVIHYGHFTINSITFNFGEPHNLAIPTLAGGTTANMETVAGEPFSLTVSESDGFWREYANENYRWDQQLATIPSGEYNTPTHTFSEGLTVGEHFFAAQRSSHCGFEENHVSDLVKIKVVVSAPFSPSFDLNFTPQGGQIGSNATWANGVLISKAGNDNWVEVKDVDGYASNYSGIRVTTKGDACRIIVDYTDNEGNTLELKKNIDATPTYDENSETKSREVTTYYSWAMLGVPQGKIGNVKRIRFAGEQNWLLTESNTSTVQFVSAQLVNEDHTHRETTDAHDDKVFDLSSHPHINDGSFNRGDIEWTYKEVNDGTRYATLKTAATNNNQMEVFNNLNGVVDNAGNFLYTGMRIISKGEHYRVIVNVNDGTRDSEGRDVGTNYIKEVVASDSKAYVHIGWDEFIKQWGNTTMTDEDLAKVRNIKIAGCSTHSLEESVDFYSIILDKLPTNTILTDNTDSQDIFAPYQGGGGGDLSYSLTINGLTTKVTFNNINGTDRDNDGCKGVKLHRGTGYNGQTNEMRVTAPKGYRVKKVKVGLGHEEYAHYNVSFNGGAEEKIQTNDGGAYKPYLEYINNATNQYKDCVRMVIRSQSTADNEEQLHITYVTFELETSNINESRQVTTSGAPRDFWLYVPAVATQNPETEYPVVFSLHGTGNDYVPTGGGVQNFNTLAEEKGFIVVYPRGRELTFPGWGGTARGWEATGNDNQDIQYFKDIIAAISNSTKNGIKEYSIKQDQIYITGYSNGGMMTYSAANCASDVFAAFASISGFPLNEMHLRHHGKRPVPFLHIHGTKDSFVKYVYTPTIRDNMLTRNGLSYTPTSIEEGNALGLASSYKRFEYSTGNYAAPYIFYQIGTGITTSDTGMGHDYECQIGNKNSKEIVWEFLSQYTLPANAATQQPSEFKAEVSITSGNLNTEVLKNNNNAARNHGWEVNEGMVIASYGKSGATSLDQNTYHSLQLRGGETHYIKFNATNSDNNKVVTVRLTRLADLDAFNTLNAPGFTLTNDVVLEKSYKTTGEIVVKFDATEMTDGEYNLTFLRHDNTDMTTISSVEISTTGTEKGTTEPTPNVTDFTGWFNYENRLGAQWNFDLCDGPRFIASALGSNWKTDYSNTDAGGPSAKFGTITYTYNAALNNEELTYDGTYRIPVTGGLKFTADAGLVKIKTTLKNGVVASTQLVVENGVTIEIPYVQNSFRNDKGSVSNPTVDTKEDYQNCMHHIKRDIVYIAVSDGNVWNKINTTDNDITYENKTLYTNGGDEFINGKTFNKVNHCGDPDKPFVFKFNRTTEIERIAVNRNLTYSFYTEYINKLGYDMPASGLRIEGHANGLDVANVGKNDRGGDIAFTYGGWENKNYTSYDNTPVTDAWGNLHSYNGVGQNDYQSVPIPSDGFYMMSLNNVHATSEALMPSNTTGNTYHPANDGLFDPTAAYQANVTPWTLPARGAYNKFEPTSPGVLNVHIYQYKNNVYYITDEFGNLINKDTQNASLFIKTGTSQENQMEIVNGGFRIPESGHDDYVKYSFNVFPGKTYYVFSNTAGMGTLGFYFEPFVCRTKDGTEFAREDIGVYDIAFDDAQAYSTPAKWYPDGAQPIGNGSKIYVERIQSPTSNGYKEYPINYSLQAVNATVNRSFDADKWNSVCLPFSMNRLQMEKVFGKGTRVLLLRDLQDAETSKDHDVKYDLRTINFIAHESQDILAGYPYFILPTKRVESIQAYVSLYDTTPEIPSNIKSDAFGGLKGYTFTGLLSGTTAPQYSYYLGKSGNLSQCTKESGVALKSYRAYLHFNGEENAAKSIQAINFDDEIIEIGGNATDIDDLLFNSGIMARPSNVYSVSGQLIRSNTTSLNGLPKGAYIVNGKKYFVK